MIPWTPITVPNVSVPYSPCAAIEAYQLARPPLSSSFAIAHIVVFVILTFLIVFFSITHYMLRNEPRLRPRPVFLNATHSVGVFLSLVIVILRRGVLDEHGHPVMECHAFAIMYVLCVPILSAVGILRLANIINKERFVLMAKHVAAAIPTQDGRPVSLSQDALPTSRSHMATHVSRDMSMSINTAGGGSSSTKIPKPCPSLLKSVLNLLNLSFVSPDADRDVALAVSSKHQIMHILHQSADPQSLLLLTGMLALPSLIFLGILFAVVEPYQSVCYGCDLTAEVLILSMGSHIYLMPLTVFTFKSLTYYQPDDRYGIIFEHKLYALAIPFTFLAFILYGTDPQRLDYDNVVAWEWLWAACMVWVFIVSSPLQVILAYREIYSVSATLMKEALRADLVETIENNDRIKHLFEQYCEVHDVIEHFRFLVEIRFWVTNFSERSTEWKVTKAKQLVTIYISQGAPLQVNVSSMVRTEIEKTVKSWANTDTPHVARSLFDGAFDEVQTLTKYGPWKQFLRHNESVLKEIARPASVTMSSSSRPSNVGGGGSNVMGNQPNERLTVTGSPISPTIGSKQMGRVSNVSGMVENPLT